MTARRILAGLIATFLVGAAYAVSAAERLVQSMTEARTYVYFSANKDAVQKALPAGWVSNPASGPLKDANMFIALIEGIASDNAEGKPVLHQGKSAVLVLPVKNEKTGEAAAMVVGGFVSDPQAAPGAYGVYVPGKFSVVKNARAEGSETVMEESWAVSTDSGDKLQFTIVYPRGVATRAHVEPRIYAAAKPEFYRVYKADQVTEIVHSMADESKRAKKAELTASGPQIAKLFDGKEQLVAVMTIPAYYRQIFLPE
jgi:hypothetical protein